jgi:hypothetical protein
VVSVLKGNICVPVLHCEPWCGKPAQGSPVCRSPTTRAPGAAAASWRTDYAATLSAATTAVPHPPHPAPVVLRSKRRQPCKLAGGAADSNHDCLGHDGARRVSELSARATARLAGTRTPHPGRVQPYRYHGGGNHFRWVTTGGWELEEPAAASLRSCIRLQSFRHQRHETLADCLDGLHIH